MNKQLPRSIVNEVYSHVIEVTVESLKKYLEKTRKNSFRYNVLAELKSRWQARINCLFYSLEDSWLKFQEAGTKYSDFTKKVESSNIPISVLNFPLVCNLSWDLYQYLGLNISKISGFKSWVWNSLVSQMINEGVYPCQSMKIKLKKTKIIQPMNAHFVENIYSKYGKNSFAKYTNFLTNGLNFYVNPTNKLTLSKKTVCQNYEETILLHNFDSLGSELDEEIESQEIDENEEKIPKNFILAVTEKVYRRNTKWRIILKDGILHMNDKDLLFNSCKCEFFW